MKVGVIGVGYWGRKHVDEYSHLGHEIVVSDLSHSNLEFCKLNYGVTPVKDYHDILNDGKIECVSICTPNSTHYKIGIETLNAGKNVLIEKPIATTTKEADEIIKLAKSKNVVLLVGHIYRFNNAVKKIKELIANKQLGKIYTVNFCWANLEPVFPDRDILFDLGVHPLDMLDQIFGKKPVDLFCSGGRFRQNNTEYAVINHHFRDSFTGSDVFVNIELSWLNPIRARKMIIVGSEKTAIVDCVIQKIQLINNQSGVSEDVQLIPNNTIQDELKFFLETSQNKINIDDLHPNGEVGKRIVEIIEYAQKSLNRK